MYWEAVPPKIYLAKVDWSPHITIQKRSPLLDLNIGNWPRELPPAPIGWYFIVLFLVDDLRYHLQLNAAIFLGRRGLGDCVIYARSLKAGHLIFLLESLDEISYLKGR